MSETRLKITRVGNKVTCHYWGPDEDPIQILEQHLTGDFDIQFDVELPKQEKWYEKITRYLRQMWQR